VRKSSALNAVRTPRGHLHVEFLTPLGQKTPDVSWHVHWFHRSAAEAKAAGAMADPKCQH
jgi:hypothetical protein